MISYRLLKKMLPLTQEEKNILACGEIDRDFYMTVNHTVINSQKLMEKGKVISVRPHPRFVDFPEHSHDYIEMVYMCLGSTTHIINGKQVLLSEGELLFLGRGARHSIKRAGENDIAINFFILPQFFSSTLSSLGDEDTPLKRFIARALDESDRFNYLLFKVAGELPVQNLIENLVFVLLNDTNSKYTVNRVTMELLFQHLMDCTNLIAYENESDETIVKFLKYIDDNYKNGTLTEAASLLFCDPSWLSREVKRKTGSNYTEILQRRRLSQAVFYLANTNMTAADISSAVGYDNVSYFYRIFRKEYGVTPKEFRRRHGCK